VCIQTQSGYFPADTLLEMNIGYAAPIDSDGAHMEYVPIESLAVFSTAVKRLISWRDKGYLDIESIWDANPPDWNKYSAAFLNTSTYQIDTRETYFRLIFYALYPMDGFDMMDQAMQILYPETLPETRLNPGLIPASYSVIGGETNDAALATWLSFLEWLHQDAEHLRLLLWGEENVEYSMASGTYEALPIVGELTDPRIKDPDYRSYFSAKDHFIDWRYSFSYNTWVVSESMEAETDNLIRPPCAQAERLQEKAGKVLSTIASLKTDPATGISAVLTARSGAVKGFLDRLLRLNADQVDAEIAKFAEQQSGNNQKIREMLEVLWALDE
jgi:hypothetical protein